MEIAEDWTPTADNINALPRPVRDYIHSLETNADPAGMVRENAILKHDIAEFELRLAETPKPCLHVRLNVNVCEDCGAKFEIV